MKKVTTRTLLLIAGAAVDYTEGFVGCMRALQVNGEMLDLMGKVERGEVTYGVSAGLFLYFCTSTRPTAPALRSCYVTVCPQTLPKKYHLRYAVAVWWTGCNNLHSASGLSGTKRQWWV